jgi:hypothetical protein
MCARCFEMMVMMGVGTVIMVGAMFMFERGSFHRNYDLLEDEMSAKKFAISCSAEGQISQTPNEPNCIESNGYRVVRQGITTTIFRVDKDGEPKPMYRSGYGNGLSPSSGEMYGVIRAFRADPKP